MCVLVVTEPDIPAEGVESIIDWIHDGGHLLTMPGAAAYDRYHRQSKTLHATTGIRETTRHRLMVNAASLVPVANGTGNLGGFTAFGPSSHLKVGTGLGNVTVIPGSAAVVVARFENGAAAIIQNPAIGKGAAMHFAYMPCIHFPEIDPFKAQPDFNNMTNFTDGSEKYLLRFLQDAGVAPRVRASVPQVETPLIVSSGGAVLTLLNWRETSVMDLKMSVSLDFDVAKVIAVHAMTKENIELHFTSTASPTNGRFMVNFTIELLEHSDFVMMERKRAS
eukprot:SAG31_NODE_286_length_18467_cov_41.317056_11_plen_278_part_00